MDINFYYVKSEYIDFLKSEEIKKRGFTCVPNTEYSSREKFLFGAVFTVNEVNFFVPVSSKIKNRDNNIIITDVKDKSKKLGSLRFQYMIPVPNKCLILLKINSIPQEDRRRRVQAELKYCRRNIHKIKLQSQKTYNAILNSKNEKLLLNSCDFKLLEDAYIIYCHDNGLTLNETQEKRYHEITNLQSETLHERTEPNQRSKFTFSRNQLNENVKMISETVNNESRQSDLRHTEKNFKDKTV